MSAKFLFLFILGGQKKMSFGKAVSRSHVITCDVCWDTLGAVGPAAWAELVLWHLADEIWSTFPEPAPQSRPHKGTRQVSQNFQSCPADCWGLTERPDSTPHPTVKLYSQVYHGCRKTGTVQVYKNWGFWKEKKLSNCFSFSSFISFYFSS